MLNRFIGRFGKIRATSAHMAAGLMAAAGQPVRGLA